MLRNNFLKNKLESGKTVIGTWAVMPSAVSVDVIAASGPDFVIIDCEHGPVGNELAQTMIMACESRGVSAGVRVPGVSEPDILKALDIGAHIVHVPNVASVPAAKRIIEYAKYPPAGNRGFSPFTRAGGYSGANASLLAAKANNNVLTAIHIEGRSAIDELEQIVKIKGIDVIFLGLYDLSKSLGIAGKVDSREVKSLLVKAVKIILKAGKYPGTIATSPDQVKEFLRYGVKYITYSVDCHMLLGAYEEAISHFRKVAGR